MESDPTPDYGSDSGSRAHLRSAKHRDRIGPFERRIRFLCLFVAAPGFVLAAILLWQGKFSTGMVWTLLGGAAFLSLIAGALLMEQIIRPTGLLDPEVEIRPIRGQVDDLLHEIGRAHV